MKRTHLSHPSTTTHRRRHGTLGKLGLGVLAALGVSAGALVVLDRSSSQADASGTYHVTNTGGIGVRLRNSPRFDDIYGPGPREGAPIGIVCQTWGDPVGSRSNHIWDLIDFGGVRKYIPDTYADTPAPANQYSGGLARCGQPAAQPVAAAPAPATPPPAGGHTVLGGVDVGVAQNAAHAWGSCTVQDFKAGPFGWVIVSRSPATAIVRNGMLFGWFDQGGAPGRLGCPLGNEYTWNGGTRQDFQQGSLMWFPTMDHAQPLVTKADKAIGWAYQQMTTAPAGYYHLCLLFGVEAWRIGGGVHLDGPYGDAVTALQWWKDPSTGAQHTDANPPRGALVYWDASYGAAGHVGISLGTVDGALRIISTAEKAGPGGSANIHVMKLSDRSAGYAGWKFQPGQNG